MEFWGVEVKPGETLKVKPGQDKVLHLSQASLGEMKKDKGDAIILHVKIDENKLVVGTLSTVKATHISYDLVFEKDFELSHTGKTGSVYFCGYRSVLSLSSEDEDLLYGSDFDSEDSESEEDLPVIPTENGKPEDNKAKKDNAAKTDSAADAKTAESKKVKLVDPKKGKKPMADDNDEDDDSDDESDDEEMVDSDDSSDDEDSSEEEATPEKVQQGKKKPAESASKTDKKAKLVTPQKSGGDAKKGGGHTATPYPKGGKTPASGNQSKQQQSPKTGNQQSPKSGGQKRNFTPGSGGGRHNKKGKHSGGK